MKVYKLTEDEKAIVRGFATEQAKITAVQNELNSRIKAAVDALYSMRGFKGTFVLSEDGEYLVEAQMSRPEGGPRGMENKILQK